MVDKENILQFLKELKYSTPYNAEAYMNGSCFRVYCMLKSFFPAAKALYSSTEGHWLTEIDGKIFDINGEVDVKYAADKEYQIITDETTLQSAYIPTWKGQCTSYSKYIKTV